MKNQKARRNPRVKDEDPEGINPRIWHPYRLQKLNSDKFIRAVNKILQGDELLIEFLTFDEIMELATGKGSED